jgi:hypothetical protein
MIDGLLLERKEKKEEEDYGSLERKKDSLLVYKYIVWIVGPSQIATNKYMKK